MHRPSKRASQGNLDNITLVSSHIFTLLSSSWHPTQLSPQDADSILLFCRQTVNVQVDKKSYFPQQHIWTALYVIQTANFTRITFFHFAPPYSKQTYFHLSHNLAEFVLLLCPNSPAQWQTSDQCWMRQWFSFLSTWLESIFHAGLFFGLPTESARRKVHRDYKCLKTGK